MWGFLQEFWDAVASTTISAWEYTDSWFKNIGLAVAGAIGGAFDWLLHYVSDFFIFLGWIFAGLRTLFSIFIAPMSFFANFLRNFWGSATQSPVAIADNLNIYSTSTMAIFNAIPAWDTMTYVLGICLLLVGAFGVIYLLMRI